MEETRELNLLVRFIDSPLVSVVHAELKHNEAFKSGHSSYFFFSLSWRTMTLSPVSVAACFFSTSKT